MLSKIEEIMFVAGVILITMSEDPLIFSNFALIIVYLD